MDNLLVENLLKKERSNINANIEEN